MIYTITRDEKPSADDVSILSAGLASYGQEIVGDTWFRNIAFYLRDGSDKIMGGVYGNFGSFGWMYVDTLWVSPELRGSGHGRALMEKIEAEALQYNCHSSYLSTFSFQAPEFYKKLGYEVFGALADFPGHHNRLFLCKCLRKN